MDLETIKTPGDLRWETVTSAQGSLVILNSRQTSIGNSEATFTSYYDDNRLAPASNCTGDGQAWGTSGVGVIFSTSCTDPIGGSCGVNSASYRTLRVERSIYFLQPNVACSIAQPFVNRRDNAVTAKISDF